MTNFKINSNKKDAPDVTVQVYTYWGEHEYLDEDGYPMLNIEDIEDVFNSTDAYAIKFIRGAKTNYYVKRGKHGRLYNPIGMYSEGNSKKQLKHAGKPEWNFNPTNEKIFNYYINFLKTKNAAWLNNAEREV